MAMDISDLHKLDTIGAESPGDEVIQAQRDLAKAALDFNNKLYAGNHDDSSPVSEEDVLLNICPLPDFVAEKMERAKKGTPETETSILDR